MVSMDQRQRERLDELELEILNYVAILPFSDAIKELKEELQRFGFGLGHA